MQKAVVRQPINNAFWRLPRRFEVSQGEKSEAVSNMRLVNDQIKLAGHVKMF